MRRRRPGYKKPVTLPQLPKWSLWAITGIWWVLLIVLVLTVDPERLKNVMFTGMYFPFLLLFFLAISGTLFLFRKRFWPSVIWAIGVSVYLVLRIFGWGNVINLIVIALCLAVWEGYWWLTNRKQKPLEILAENEVDRLG